MAKVFIEESTLTSIGNSIRNKTGKTDLIDPLYMSAEIDSIGGGSGRDAEEMLKGIIELTITDLVIPEGIEKIGDAVFSSKTQIVTVTIPASVTSIGVSAFASSNNITRFTFASGSQLQTIGNYAFRYCTKLTSITIPASVTSIGSYALAMGSTSTSQKSTITMLSETPPTIESNTFDTTKLKKIRIPAAASIAYANANVWSTLTSYFVTY